MPKLEHCDKQSECALVAVRGTQACENCRKHKAWTSTSEYYASKRDYERELDLANDELHRKQLDNERLGRPSWSSVFMSIALLIAKRSKDPHTKVGAVLVKDNRVLGIGYNGEPRDFRYMFDWNTDAKYDFVIHAELNAIANACSIGANVVGADIYLTLSPCHECMKLLIQHGIRNVYYLEKYKDFDKTVVLSTFSKVKLIRLKEDEMYE